MRIQISPVERLGVQKDKCPAIGRGIIYLWKQVLKEMWATKPPLYAQAYRPVPHRCDVGKTFEDY